MGQELSPSLEAEPSQAIMNQLSNRFTILPHPYYSNTAILKLLNQSSTNTKYVLRIITTNNQSEHHRIEELINKKIANKNSFITKLQQYFFEHEKSYCGNLSKCYLLFNVGTAISAKDYFFVKQNGKNYEQQLMRGLNSLINGLLWLKSMQTPHGNISSQNIYLSKDGLMLTDPWIAPQGIDLNDRFPSPEKLMKMNNKIQDYDQYASDLFSIGMSILELSKQQKLDKIYKKNYCLNTEVLIDEINRCPYAKLRQVLGYLLLSNQNNRKQYLFDHEIAFKIQQQVQPGRDRREKGGIRRINVMSNRQNSNKVQNIINFQAEAPQRNFSRQNKVEHHIIHQNKPPSSVNPQNQLLFTFGGKEMPAENDPTSLRSKSNTKIQFNYTQNVPIQANIIQLPQFIPPQPRFHIETSPNPPNFNNFPKFTLKQTFIPPPPLIYPNPQQTPTNIPQNNMKPKKVSLNDKLNRYYYEHVYKSENNINMVSEQAYTISTQPSLPNIPNITSVSRLSKGGSPELQTSQLRSEKQPIKENNEQTPLNYRPPTNPDSHSAEFTQYLHCIDDKINKFQMGVSNAIHHTIMEIQKTSQVNKKQSQNTIQDNTKSQKYEKRLTTIIGQSQISNQSEIHLPESCEPIERNHKQSEHLSDSLLMEINKIESEEKIQRIQAEVINAVSYGVNSSRLKTELNDDGQDVLSSINEPSYNEQENTRNTIIHGTQLETVSNLAIPEQASSQEESFDSNLENIQQKGVECEEYYENGGYYKGMIKNGERNGHGTFYYRDGGYYEGQWKDNKMNGFGRLYYESGELAYQGQWYKDEFHGRGKIYNDNPQKLTESFDYKDFENQDLYWKYYEGDLSYDTKEGHGKLVLSNGEHYIGEFKGDRPSGRGHFHLLSKKVVHGIWQQGKLIKQN